jgi:hypothetical protein
VIFGQRRENRIPALRAAHTTSQSCGGPGEADQKDIEQDRRPRRHGKLAQRVQHRTEHRGQGDQRQIRKHDLRQQDGQTNLFRLIRKSRRDDIDEIGHRGGGDQGENEQGARQHRQRLLAQPAGFGLAIVEAFCEERHKGEVERPLAKNAPKKVRQAKGGIEGIGGIARAQGRRNHDLAHHAEDARSHRHAAHGQEGPAHAHGATPV